MIHNVMKVLETRIVEVSNCKIDPREVQIYEATRIAHTGKRVFMPNIELVLEKPETTFLLQPISRTKVRL